MHSYPRIRRITAEQFYIKLVEQGDLHDGDEILELLLNSPWDTEMPTTEIADRVLQVASLLKVGHLVAESLET